MRFLQGAVSFDLFQRSRVQGSISGQTITAAQTEFLTLNLGNVVLNDIVMVSLYLNGIKAATPGVVNIQDNLQAGSTGTWQIADLLTSIGVQVWYPAGENVAMYLSQIARVTSGGTAVISVTAFSLGSNVTGAQFAASAYVLRGE